MKRIKLSAMNFRKGICFFVTVNLLIMGFLMIFFANMLCSIAWQNNDYEKRKTEKGAFKLSNKYDLEENQSLMKFYNQHNALNILWDTYNEIKRNNNLKYYEYSDQSLTYLGYFNGDLSLVDGYDETFINQESEVGIITPLKSVQISYEEIVENNLDESIDIGSTFSDLDYKYSDNHNINLVMGANFKKYFNINDKFSAYYLGEEKFTCKVIGFYVQNTNLNIAGIDGLIDDYIVFPLFNLDKEQIYNSNFLKLALLTNKIEGYVQFDDLDECNRVIDEVDKISQKTGYKYNIEALKYKYPKPEKLIVSYPVSVVLSIISIIVFFMIVLLVYIILVKNILDVSDVFTVRDTYIYKSKFFLVYMLMYIFSYVVSKKLMGEIFKIFGYLDVGFIFLPLLNTSILIVFIILIKLIFKKINRSIKIRGVI